MTKKTLLKNCNFETWAFNHSPEHKDRIYRELYPYSVFQRINFSENFLNKKQTIEFNKVKYFVEVLKIELQENEKYRTTFSLKTILKSTKHNWENRCWNEMFQIVYTTSNDFITVFTKNEDSSKDLLKRYFKGNFQKIYANRSKPLSDLLFRTLVLNLSEDLFGDGDLYYEFELKDTQVVNNEEHYQFKNKKSKYSPLFSKGTELWVCHSFDEEKAHRIGFYLGNNTKKLYVIYCNPTYTRHHRCTYQNVEILSLFEFAFKHSKNVFNNYDQQIRLLQNHLNEQVLYSESDLLKEIENPIEEKYEIYKSELMESLGIMKIAPKKTDDLFLYLSAMNLLNAWINRQKQTKTKKKKLFRDMYFFKTYLSNTISEMLNNEKLLAKIYLEPNLAMIEINNFQFSFHHVPLSDKMKEFLNSDKNIEIIWSGKRLQPIAPLLFRYARQLNKKVSA